MRERSLTIIAERSPRLRDRALACIAFAAALGFGTTAAIYYARHGLTLSHYDARAHLVVARRVIDSLTPGWRQIGAVWLPLPHLLDFFAVQSDWGYRTGYPSTAFSVLALSGGLAALAVYIRRCTGSLTAALAAPLLVLANPNLLYLQSTPMTEPLLLGLACVGLLAVDRWIEAPDDRARRAQAQLALAALTLTRYEAWFMVAGLLTVAAIQHRRRGIRTALALVPAVAGAVVAFLALSYASTGRLFVDDGFFVPNNPALHQPWLAARQVAGGIRDLGGDVIMAVAAIGAVLALARFARRGRGSDSLAVGLAACVLLPSYAFFQGHPYRVRYMVPDVAVCGMLAGLALGYLPRRARLAGAAALLTIAIVQHPPLEQSAPMVVEAQWETPYRQQREIVTRYLSAVYDGTPILASMGSLGHYMQETSHAGFRLADFLHEGNGDLWAAAIEKPSRHVNWMLVEERARGGDQLAEHARRDAGFVEGFVRVAEGGGLVLYERVCDAPAGCAGRSSPAVLESAP